MRKYTLNENYFESIKTEHQAYWLGMLTADGWIKNKLNGWAISLGLKDKDHLHCLQKDIDTNRPLRYRNYKNSETYTLEICSRKMAIDLCKLGVIPKKSKTVKPWEGTKSLLRHYWRGVFDGDGCISRNKLRKRGGYCYTLYLCGSEYIARGFADFIEEQLGFCCLPFFKSNIFYSSYGGTLLPQKIAHLLYDKSSICLSRKKALIDELLCTKILRYNRSDWTLEYLNFLYQRYGMWTLVANHLKVSSKNLDGIKRRLIQHNAKFMVPT